MSALTAVCVLLLGISALSASWVAARAHRRLDKLERRVDNIPVWGARSAAALAAHPEKQGE